MRLFQAIIPGDPGSGKNGLLASAADAGYRIIIGSFEAGSEVTQQYTKHPENVHVVHFADGVEWDDDKGMTFKPKAAIALERFIFNGRPQGFPKNETLPYGRPREWDEQTIFVLDTLTTLGSSCEVRQAELNPQLMGPLQAYNAALDQERICELLISYLRCHIIVLSHLRLISPKAENPFATATKPETELQKKIKRERAALQDTGFFPTMVTEGVARNVVLHFPFALMTELDFEAKNASKRVLRTKPVPGFQIKCPLDIPDKLPIEIALATILEKLG